MESTIHENYIKLKESIPKEVLLVVVSKGRSCEEIMECYQAGAKDFAENRVHEFIEKKAKLPTDIKWHMIGHIQTKKIPKIIGQFNLIQSIDTFDLLYKIDQKNVKTEVLLEVNTSGERAKHGLSPQEWMTKWPEIMNLKHINIQGFMTMAPHVNDENLIIKAFKDLRLFRDALGVKYKFYKELSMGMSQDYKIAIEQGATILRVGTAIFKTKKNV